MPANWRRVETDYSILVWKSEEEIEDLLAAVDLTPEETESYNGFKSINRKREWLTVRIALKNLLPGEKNLKIFYDDNGRPYVKNGFSISISHSQEYIAVIVSGKPKTGIDIELIHPRILQLGRKFVSEEENSTIENSHDKEVMHVIWGAKEVLYKLHGTGGLDFKKELRVMPFTLSHQGILQASILKRGYESEHKIYYEKLENYMLAWSV